MGFSVYPLTVASNNTVKTIPQKRRNVGGFVFYEVRVVSMENKTIWFSKKIIPLPFTLMKS
jgi:hypothetical protein